MRFKNSTSLSPWMEMIPEETVHMKICMNYTKHAVRQTKTVVLAEETLPRKYQLVRLNSSRRSELEPIFNRTGRFFEFVEELINQTVMDEQSWAAAFLYDNNQEDPTLSLDTTNVEEHGHAFYAFVEVVVRASLETTSFKACFAKLLPERAQIVFKCTTNSLKAQISRHRPSIPEWNSLTESLE